MLALLTGTCACGCNQPTPLATQSRPKWQQYSGFPLRFIHGHQTRVLKGARASKWRGGRRVVNKRREAGGSYSKNGYVLVYMPDHSMANVQGYVLEHRLVVSRMLGRDLRRDEEVHHRNGQRGDNRPENLELWTRAHPPGMRVEDLVAWARALVNEYGHLFPAY